MYSWRCIPHNEQHLRPNLELNIYEYFLMLLWTQENCVAVSIYFHDMCLFPYSASRPAYQTNCRLASVSQLTRTQHSYRPVYHHTEPLAANFHPNSASTTSLPPYGAFKYQFTSYQCAVVAYPYYILYGWISSTFGGYLPSPSTPYGSTSCVYLQRLICLLGALKWQQNCKLNTCSVLIIRPLYRIAALMWHMRTHFNRLGYDKR
jgi:hypothetical protein